MPITLTPIKVVSEGSTEILSVDLTLNLDGTELASSGTVAEVSTSDLTLTNLAGTAGLVTVNSAAVTINGKSAAIGKAVQWVMSGQQAGTTYRLRITYTTDSTPARVLVQDAQVACV